MVWDQSILNRYPRMRLVYFAMRQYQCNHIYNAVKKGVGKKTSIVRSPGTLIKNKVSGILIIR